MRMIAKKNSAETTAVSCVRHSTQTQRDSAPRHECQKHSISRGGEHRSSTGRRPTPEDTAKESCPPPTCTKQCYPNRCDADQRPGRTTPKRRRLAQANRKASSHPRRSLRRDSKDGAIRTGEQPGKRAARMRKPRKKEPRRRTYARTSKHASDIRGRSKQVRGKGTWHPQQEMADIDITTKAHTADTEGFLNRGRAQQGGCPRLHDAVTTT